MRPTEIQERSPQQRTPSMLLPMVTSKGYSLVPASPLYNPKSKSTFPRSDRWEYIRDISDRTAPQNGPGSHKYKFSTNKGRGPRLLNSSFIESGQNVNDYYYSGNLLCRKSENSSPVSASGSLPKIQQTFSGLDKFMKSRIFLKDASSHNSSRVFNKSEVSRIGGESRRQPRGTSPESTLEMKEMLGKESESIDFDTVPKTQELSNLIKKVNTQIRQKGSQTPDRQHISPSSTSRKPYIPLRILPEIQHNNSFMLTPTPMRDNTEWSPLAKDRKEYYLTGMAGQNKTFEMAKRRLRPKVNAGHKKKNNSFSNGLYIRTPLDL